MTSFYRSSPPIGLEIDNLGLLRDLPGRWVGSGFNLISRPFFDHPAGAAPFFLELSATDEILDFKAIGGKVFNRGSIGEDIGIFGVSYLQQVTDRQAHSGLHVEPGFWLRVPVQTIPPPQAADDPSDPAKNSYVRQATIPHGDALLALSSLALSVNGGPQIDPVDSTPFTGDIPDLNTSSATPLTDPVYLAQFAEKQLPAFLPEDLLSAPTIKDPSAVLRAQIAGQTISQTIVLKISTANKDPSGTLVNTISNIPFVRLNANAVQMDAIFWIETVERDSGQQVMQLQYVQRVILDFLTDPTTNKVIHWPHISVATLVKQ